MLIGLLFAAAVGGCCRFALTNLLAYLWQKPFPLPTLIVNFTGCFVIGGLWAGQQVNQLSEDYWRLLALAAVGSFTTVSSFSLQTVSLWQAFRKVVAVSYVLLSVLGGLLWLLLGIWLGRAWW